MNHPSLPEEKSPSIAGRDPGDEDDSRNPFDVRPYRRRAANAAEREVWLRGLSIDALREEASLAHVLLDNEVKTSDVLGQRVDRLQVLSKTLGAYALNLLADGRCLLDFERENVLALAKIAGVEWTARHDALVAAAALRAQALEARWRDIAAAAEKRADGAHRPAWRWNGWIVLAVLNAVWLLIFFLTR